MMLRSLNALRGYQVRGSDGDIGAVHDLLFDDELWLIRDLVVDTSSWVRRRKLLVSPVLVRRISRETQTLDVALTRAAARERSDGVISGWGAPRVAERHEGQYGWSLRGGGIAAGLAAPAIAYAAPGALLAHPAETTDDARILFSARQFAGFGVEARDGLAGRVEDVVADDEHWAVRYLVMNGGTRARPQRALIATGHVLELDTARRRIRVNRTSAQLRATAVYNPAEPVHNHGALDSFDFQGRPHYC